MGSSQVLGLRSWRSLTGFRTCSEEAVCGDASDIAIMADVESEIQNMNLKYLSSLAPEPTDIPLPCWVMVRFHL